MNPTPAAVDTIPSPKQNMTPEEAKISARYGGKKPASHLDRFRQGKARKHYFDSGDYAIAKAGKGDAVEGGAVGSQHPKPETIPHPATPAANASGGVGPKIPGLQTGIPPHPSGQFPSPAQASGSPAKETSFLSRETSAEDLEREDEDGEGDGDEQLPLHHMTARGNSNHTSVDEQQQQAKEQEDPAQTLPIRT